MLGGDRVLVLGGGNHGAFHSLRDVMIWHASSATWVKLQTRLAPGCKMPSSALYHSVTPLEEPLHHGSSIGSSTSHTRRGTDSGNSKGCGGGTRRVLMFGGTLGDVPGVARASHHEYRPPPPHLFVLDLPNLRCDGFESIRMY